MRFMLPMPDQPPFAFGWLNPPMLGWLAAAAAPILIYLLMRRTRRETDWAAMEFLRAAVEKRSRRIRFEHWLLPTVRTLLIALVVIAAAEPRFDSSGMSVSPGQNVHRVLVFDGSFSMACVSAGETRFDRAKEQARRIVEASSGSDVFSLVLMSRRPRVLLNAAPDRAAILREIDNLQPTYETAELPPTVAEIGRLIAENHEKNPRLDRRAVYFLTDMQRTTWAPKLSGPVRTEFLRQSSELAKSATLILIDVGRPLADNLAIVDLRPADWPVLTGRDATLRAELRDFGRQPRQRQNVDLLVDGKRIARKEVDVPPGGTASVEFSYTFDAPGDHSVEVAAPGDDLDIDNRRFLALPARRELRVLCIEGRPAGERFQGAADYLAVALSPRKQPSGNARLRAETAPESALADRNLADYDCLFLCNVARFTADEARALDAYLRGGGGVVFFLGDRVEAENYNRVLGPPGQDRAGGAAILPARLGDVVDRPQFRLDPLGFRHPILNAFRGGGENSLLATPVFKYFRLSPPKDSSSTTVLAAAGDPLIVERQVGLGRAVLVATAAEPGWSALPLWSSFVPLVQEIAVFCAAGRVERRNVMVGEPLEGSFPASAAEMSPRVRLPDGGERSVRLRLSDDRAVLSYADTARSGIYAVRFNPPDNDRTFAVNVDTVESDLARIEPAELRAHAWPGVSFQHQTVYSDLDAASVGRSTGAESGLSVVLLYCALGLLFADTFLSWKFGHH